MLAATRLGNSSKMAAYRLFSTKTHFTEEGIGPKYLDRNNWTLKKKCNL